MIKLVSRVKLYVLEGVFYLQDAEDIFAIEDFPDTELLRHFFAELTVGTEFP